MKRLAMLSLLSVILLTGCAFHIPGPLFEDDYFPVTVRLDIDPDDAEVYIDGRLIGEAYEFSTAQTAIRLSSRNHRLSFRRDGYHETVTDLDSYRGRRITLWLSLKALSGDRGDRPDLPKVEKAPAPKEPLPPPSKDTAHEEAVPAGRFALILTVEPAEATIYVNDRFWGISPADGKIGRIAFAEKEIRIDVLKPGFKPWSKKLSLTEKGEELNLKLEAVQK